MNPDILTRKLTEDDLREVVEVVCMTVLETQVEPASASDFVSDDYLICSISICGAWNGTVKLMAGCDFLNRAASHMFSIEPGAVGPVDRIDSFTELNNMLGGTVKSLLPEPCNLSLPLIISSDSLKGAAQHWIYFLCEDQALAVAVTEASSGVEKAA